MPQIQVITMSHRLSLQTHDYLRTLGSVKVFHAPLHVTRFNKVVEEVTEHLIKLKEHPLHPLQVGGIRTIFVLGGSSLTAVTMMAVWEGMTGDPPEILNMIKRGEQLYIPSPELPLVSLGSIRNNLRMYKRAGEVQVQIL